MRNNCVILKEPLSKDARVCLMPFCSIEAVIWDRSFVGLCLKRLIAEDGRTTIHGTEKIKYVLTELGKTIQL